MVGAELQLASGTWLVTSFEPVFTVADIGRSVTFYEQLGFETSFHDDTYAFAHRARDLTIHLARPMGDRSAETARSTCTAPTPTGWPRTGGGWGSP